MKTYRREKTKAGQAVLSFADFRLSSFVFRLLPSAFLLLPLASCESDVADRHASNRALRSPTEINSAENEVMAERTALPLATVDFANGPKGHTTVTTALDPLLGRQPPTGTVLQPATTPPAAGRTGTELQPAITPATMPGGSPPSTPTRGTGDSTTQP